MKEIKKMLNDNTVKIKYWFSDGSTKTWKLKNGIIQSTWNSYKEGVNSSTKKRNDL